MGKVSGKSLAGRSQCGSARVTAHNQSAAVKSVKTPPRGILAPVSTTTRQSPKF